MDIISVANEDQERVKQSKALKLTNGEEDDKFSEEQLAAELTSKIEPMKMSDYFYWFNSSDVVVQVEDTTFIIPKDYFVRQDGIQLHRELRASAKKVHFRNLANWEAVPHLADSLNCFQSSQLAAFSRDTSRKSNKFQVSWSLGSLQARLSNVTRSWTFLTFAWTLLTLNWKALPPLF